MMPVLYCTVRTIPYRYNSSSGSTILVGQSSVAGRPCMIPVPYEHCEVNLPWKQTRGCREAAIGMV